MALPRASSRLVSKSRSVHDSRATLQNMHRLTKGIIQVDKISASMTLNEDLNSVTSASVRGYADKTVEHSEMRLSRFPPDAQPRPTILSRFHSKEEKAGTGLLAQHK